MVHAYWRGASGRVVHQLVSTRQIGWGHRLYSWRPDPVFGDATVAEELETGYFSPIDHEASRVLGLLRAAQPQPLDAKSKRAMACFLNSLMERDPETLGHRTEGVREIGEDVLAEARLRPDPFGIISRSIKLFDLETGAWNLARQVMVQRIDDDPFIDWLVGQTWRLVPTLTPLITSDRPLLRNVKANNESIDVLRIAISPFRLLLIYPRDWTIDDDFLTALVFMYNVQVVEAAWRTVVADRKLGGGGTIHFDRLLEAKLRRRHGPQGRTSGGGVQTPGAAVVTGRVLGHAGRS